MLPVKSGSTDQVAMFTAPTGLSSFTVRRKRGAGAWAAMTTPTVTEDDSTNAPGEYSLVMDEDTTITAGKDTEIMSYRISAAGMQTQTIRTYLYRDLIGSGGASLTAIPWNPAWDAEVESEATDALNAYDPPTNAELTTAANAILAVLGVPSTSIAADVAAVLAAIGALEDLSAAEVNAQVLDVLNTDTFGEPAGVPAATATIVAKVGWLFRTLRNEMRQTATKKQFHNDAGVADWEKDVADDGTTYSESEANSV